jgi:hypothetical protein
MWTMVWLSRVGTGMFMKKSFCTIRMQPFYSKTLEVS